jgi:thiol:disulfide interchange protein DsbA
MLKKANSMKKLVLGGLRSCNGIFDDAAADFVAGKDYTVVANRKTTAAKKEDREFVCDTAPQLEAHMQTWLKKIPSDVYFLRTRSYA